ncbi:amino acid carrier protein [Bacillus carboniphilus]|uniref:Amino acid carrier protein n=1 Tax=Bacillus carboniphilus TaxID=86663 RepID=A0ABY9JV34_9BACI|nr:amino acid carrier protein [Bacillus carboniphilus]WLR43266.1 amino acid carrier protein [Bacillus carboniphilus]
MKAIIEWVWGIPMIVLLLGGGVILSSRIGFIQLIKLPMIFRETIGMMFSKKERSKEVSPFAAFSAALGGTVGANNIIGVPLAIFYGGPGALFWMWMVSLIGMGTIYTEILFGQQFKEKNKKDEWVGGPSYYMDRGLKWRKIARFYSVILMFQVLASVMVQSNATALSWNHYSSFPIWIIGVLMAGIVGFSLWGGINRITSIMKYFVPTMVFLYVIGTSTVIFINYDLLIPVFKSIFQHAFIPSSAMGLFPGATLFATLRWGLARGLYSSEAGLGTAAIAHSSSDVEAPEKQAYWGIIAVFFDTIVICSLTGLAVLTSGVWMKQEEKQLIHMVSNAFATVFPESIANITLACLLTLFVFSTVTILIFYGEKQAEYLGKEKTIPYLRIVYLVSIIIGSILAIDLLWVLLDVCLALLVVPNMFALLRLSKKTNVNE